MGNCHPGLSVPQVQQTPTVMVIQMRGKPLSSKNNGEILRATLLGPGDFPFGSPESRMAARIRLQRIGVAGERSSNCTCFPADEQPFFGFPIEQEIAARVLCPLHGPRFQQPRFHLYVPKWRRENEKKVRWFRLSPQSHKAWHAGFPLDLWPAEEEESEDRTVFLKLKDGTRLLAYEPVYDRPSTGKIIPVNVVAGQPKQSE
jgi:hypothetical protein